jgi:hypothetical protein
MKVDLSKHEIELLDKALQCWEVESGGQALIGGVMTAILTGKNPEQEAASKARFEKEMEKANADMKERKIKSLMLRAKLYQAISRESEHEEEAKQQ